MFIDLSFFNRLAKIKNNLKNNIPNSLNSEMNIQVEHKTHCYGMSAILNFTAF